MSLLLYNSIISNGIKSWYSVRERAKLKLFNSMKIDKKKRETHQKPFSDQTIQGERKREREEQENCLPSVIKESKLMK